MNGSGYLRMEKPGTNGVAFYKGPLTLLDGRNYSVAAVANSNGGYDVKVLDPKGWITKAEFKLGSFKTRVQQRADLNLHGNMHIVARKGANKDGQPRIWLSLFEHRPEYLV